MTRDFETARRKMRGMLARAFAANPEGSPT
jgi:hypothetical protein